MKKSLFKAGFGLVISLFVILTSLTSCKKTDNPIKYQLGFFPDTTVAIAGLNSAYDDYNSTCYQLVDNILIVFSSNRNSSGGQFDLIQGKITFIFDQTTGAFGLGSEITQDPFLTKLLDAANTTGNDFGPYTLFSTTDGYDYLLLSSQNTSGNLDFYYLKNLPVFGTNLPAVSGPYPATRLNTSAEDAYICFDLNHDSTYFSTNSEGNFDIFMKKVSPDTSVAVWLNKPYSASARVDSINSASEDKCPFIYNKIMAFASDRPGGMGGFDLYYSVFRKGKWSSPVNFGPSVNTSSDEYRPLILGRSDFTNNFLIFSSNRPGGKGGYDLYFRGITFPK